MEPRASFLTYRAVLQARWTLLVTLDAITLLSLGKSFGYVTQDKDIFEYVQTMFDNFPVMNFMTGYPPLVRLINHPAIQRFLVPSMKDSR